MKFTFVQIQRLSTAVALGIVRGMVAVTMGRFRLLSLLAAGDDAGFRGRDANGRHAKRTDQTIYEDLQSLTERACGLC